MNWIDIRVRKPTEKDADGNGSILQLLEGNESVCFSWEDLDRVIAWMPIPEFTPLPDSFYRQYRPFASAKEFEPHRTRWWRNKSFPKDNCPPSGYSDYGFFSHSWKECFEKFEFDDGTPFGVPISEE